MHQISRCTGRPAVSGSSQPVFLLPPRFMVSAPLLGWKDFPADFRSLIPVFHEHTSKDSLDLLSPFWYSQDAADSSSGPRKPG